MKRRTKKVLLIAVATVCCVSTALIGMMLYGKHQMNKIPGLTFEEALAYTTKDTPEATITVGIIKGGESWYTVYGKDGKILPEELHTYEIGSLTKTFTAALVNKAVTEGKIDLSDTIDQYLSLPISKEYPTIRELLTHTSGYKGYYFESPMIGNFFKGRNDFFGISKEMVQDKAGELNRVKEEDGFIYSNYGYAVLGLVLEAVYDTDYTTLLNDFVQNEMGLADTKISDGSGDLGNYWDWKPGDAYLSAGAVTSNITDMLAYARMQIEGNPIFSECHKSLAVINASTEDYKAMGINMDEIGMAWIIDKENGILWHNGGTGNYNCYLGFQPETGTAVVVLSNLPPSYRIPATVLGIKALHELGTKFSNTIDQS